MKQSTVRCIPLLFTETDTVKVNLFISFKVGKIKLKGLSAHVLADHATSLSVGSLKTTMIQDGYIQSLCGFSLVSDTDSNTQYEISYDPISTNLNGEFTFKLLYGDTPFTDSELINVSIMLTLEFFEL